MPVRLKRHEETALKLARWLKARPEVSRVLHPALEDDPGHAIWKRDFKGASGLFGVVFKPVQQHALAAFIDGLQHFGLGYSWGGYESLIVPAHITRTARQFDAEGPVMRIHAGLEDAGDLIADLDGGIESNEERRMSEPTISRDEFLSTVAFNADGLVPVIAQDRKTGAVLMLAWTNRETLLRTLETGDVTYWSRSRNEVWRKGETVGTHAAPGRSLGRLRRRRAAVQGRSDGPRLPHRRARLFLSKGRRLDNFRPPMAFSDN